MSFKLVIADSSPSVLKAVRSVFTEKNYEVHSFADGEGLIKDLEEIGPDILLVSLSLKKKNGYEIVQVFRSQKKWNQVPLVILKNSFDAVDENKLEGLRYDRIVEEPFDSEELVRLTRELVEGKKNPPTFPEELEPEKSVDQGEKDLDPEVKAFIRQEILIREQELEERIVKRLERLEKREKLDKGRKLIIK